MNVTVVLRFVVVVSGDLQMTSFKHRAPRTVRSEKTVEMLKEYEESESFWKEAISSAEYMKSFSWDQLLLCRQLLRAHFQRNLYFAHRD